MAFSKEVVNKMSDLMTAGFGLVAALAWNTAIQNLFSHLFGKPGSTLISQFVYAFVITVAAVLIIVWVSKLHLPKK